MSCWKSPVDESDWTADRSVCRCASLSLRPLTCDDMKGHRWGPWEQRCTQLPLKVTTFPNIRLRKSVTRSKPCKPSVICNKAEDRAVTECNFDCISTSWENSPKFPDAVESQDETTCFSRGGSSFWPALWAEHLYGSIKKKTAEVHDPDIWFTWDFQIWHHWKLLHSRIIDKREGRL